MAERPVFIPHEGTRFVRERNIDFEWVPGMAVSQKQKCIRSLHSAISTKLGFTEDQILEVSRKSENSLGNDLSAFNLKLWVPSLQTHLPVENAFQSSKTFRDGGPFLDLREVHPRDAKRDSRLRESGPLSCFRYEDEDWPLNPQTLFYDWLYLSALCQNQELANQLKRFEAFTDIEFNPKKSLNCQAHTVALFVSLERRGIVHDVLESPRAYRAQLLKGTGRDRKVDQPPLL